MKKLDFNTVLAISIHDMKNSLNMVLTSLDSLLDAGTADCYGNRDQVARLRYEARRVQNNLMQLLTLYRDDRGLYRPRFVSTAVIELLEDVWLLNKPSMEHRGIDCVLDCDPDLVWNLDARLIAGVLENVINNSVRYTRDMLRVIGERGADGWLSLRVEDNGEGFPSGMLGRRALESSGEFDRRLGHTGLGLHFCALVADSHAVGDARGHVELANGGPLGGGRFEIRLPPLPLSALDGPGQ